ncbi:60S ribosome subunit biogenesis protein NIP7 homolog isoform 2-T2 [Lycaon pictus]
MRPLTEEETRVMFEKMAKYEKILKLAANISGDKLVSLGTCFGKFTKSHRFRLHITALDYLAPYAKYKVWIKPGAEQSFLYGNHVLKSGLGRITENTCQYQGVVVYSMADVPLGFGVAAKSTQDCRKVDPMAIVVFHQADIGEYVRHEETLT